MTVLPSIAHDRSEEFSFAVLSDRTGMARPGIFERAVQVTNLMRPDFAIQVGDTIEGYTTDPERLRAMWEELDTITAPLEVPLCRVPGNHDVGNELMRTEWTRRHGPLHYHFRHRDVLFVVLNTQDPPQNLSEMLRPVETEIELPEHVTTLLANADATPEDELIDQLLTLISQEPASLQGMFEAIKNGTQPARISEEQIEQIEAVIGENSDVRWTFLFMHMPAWQGAGHPALDRVRAALGPRPYTAFAGHCHNYHRCVIDGRDHIRLGPTGGARILDTEDGDWDHITWVTMTTDGPRIANIVLDGVIGVEGGPFTPAPRPQALLHG